jgi:hypothetical protein
VNLDWETRKRRDAQAPHGVSSLEFSCDASDASLSITSNFAALLMTAKGSSNELRLSKSEG